MSGGFWNAARRTLVGGSGGCAGKRGRFPRLPLPCRRLNDMRLTPFLEGENDRFEAASACREAVFHLGRHLRVDGADDEAVALQFAELVGQHPLRDVRQAAADFITVAGAAQSVLIVGGAGGVGSIAIQLARRLTGLTVIATASRPETKAWTTALGAHHVVDHSKPLALEVAALGIGAPAFVFSTTNTDRHLAEIAALIAPQGRFALIDDPATLDINPFKRKSVSVHWEFMFTRSMFGTADIAQQGHLLNEVSRLVDEGTLRTTLAENFGAINAANLRRAHALIESGGARGKIVLEGF